MGTHSYFSFTETARQAFDLSELLNDPEHQEGVVNGVHRILKLFHPIQAYDNQPGNLNSITPRYGVAWSGKAGLHVMAGDHAKHTLTLDQMIDDLGMSDDWARNPETFGTVITREQVAAEAGVELPAVVSISMNKIFECWSDDPNDICEYECFYPDQAAEKYAEYKFQKDNDVSHVRGLDIYVKGSHGVQKFSVDVQMEPQFYATEVYD